MFLATRDEEAVVVGSSEDGMQIEWNVDKLSCNLFSERRVEQEGMKVTFVNGPDREELSSCCDGTGALDTLVKAYLRKLWMHGMVKTKVSQLSSTDNRICEVCIAGKQTKKPFEEVQEPKFRGPLEIIQTV